MSALPGRKMCIRDSYKTVLQGITPLPDKDIQIFARAHATIYALSLIHIFRIKVASKSVLE